MKILCVSGYPAWEKVSRQEMPSHHLYGIHEMIDHYEESNLSIRGILKTDLFDGGYVDFYLWNSGKKNIVKQTVELLRLSKQYDVIYDMLNRCSLFLGVFKRCGLMKSKLVTIMHHPPYKTQLKIATSDAYIFFNEEYKKIAERDNSKKTSWYYVNEWKPDLDWYNSIPEEGELVENACFYIDNGKSRRDREVLIEAADKAQIRVDYAGESDGEKGWARPYKVDLKDDTAQVRKLRRYKAIVIPIQNSKKEKIGPLGITSYLDAIALGIPVIASDNVCFADEIRKRKTGMLFETGNIDDLSLKMTKLLNDRSIYNECCDNLKRMDGMGIDQYSITLVGILENIL